MNNEYNKVVIELSGVQFWTESKLVNHAFDFSPNCTPLSSITIIKRTNFRARKFKF